ncbi:hypothetical protein PT974_10474 [Cladobotryum mycophilum]|uniref:Uncharacterized protein n=1 Tax=Cladobotryum mycophilum TaxID=491253 RepID=A0ABR0S9Y8_9HYPO
MMHQDRRPSKLWPFRRQRRETSETNPFPAQGVQGLGLVGGDLLELEQRNSSEIRFDEEDLFRYSNTTTLADDAACPCFSWLIAHFPEKQQTSRSVAWFVPIPAGWDQLDRLLARPEKRADLLPGSPPNLQNERRPSWVRRKGSSAVSALVFCAGVGSVPPTQRYLQASVAKGQM